MWLWPLISAILYKVGESTGHNVFETYIQFFIVIITFPAVLGLFGFEMQIIAILVLIYFFKFWPRSKSNQTPRRPRESRQREPAEQYPDYSTDNHQRANTGRHRSRRNR